MSATLVLFPSVIGVVARPLTQTWLIWSFLWSSLLAFILQGFVFYFSAFTDRAIPVRASGFGSIATIACLTSFVAFLFVNIRDDQLSAPTAVSLVPSSFSVAPGQIVGFSADGTDEDGDRLTWRWRLRAASGSINAQAATLAGSTRVNQWLVPADAKLGIYEVGATASDGKQLSAETWVLVKVEKAK